MSAPSRPPLASSNVVAYSKETGSRSRSSIPKPHSSYPRRLLPYLHLTDPLSRQEQIDHPRPPEVASPRRDTSSDHPCLGIFSSLHPPPEPIRRSTYMEFAGPMGELSAGRLFLADRSLRRYDHPMGRSPLCSYSGCSWSVHEKILSALIKSRRGR